MKFVFNMGLSGYMPAYNGIADTEEEAIDAILDNLNDSAMFSDLTEEHDPNSEIIASPTRWYHRDRVYARELAENGYTALHPLDGNEYAEIIPLTDDDPLIAEFSEDF